MLLTWHNLQFYQDLMAALREAIAATRLDEWKAGFEARQAAGDIEPLSSPARET